MENAPQPVPEALINDPGIVFMVLVLVVCGSIWTLTHRRLAGLAQVLPAPIWIYIIPVILASVGVLPNQNPAYGAVSAVLVPVTLFLLTVSSDFRSTLKIGHLAAIMLAAGTSGILIGGVFAYLAIRSNVPDGGYEAFAVIAAGWIGGSANGVAVQQGLDADPAILGPLLVMDSVMGYGWVAFLLFLSGQQRFLARLFGFDAQRSIDVSNVKVDQIARGEINANSFARLMGVAFFAALIAIAIGSVLPEIGDPKILTATTWTILIIVAIGVALSFTPARKLEKDGASDLGFVLILVLLASLGAQGDITALLDAPFYFIAGAVWLLTHLIILAIVARLMRAPPVLFALGSVANIGGFATAPIVAAAYQRSFVPTALLMAAIAQVAGTYLPFLFASFLASLG